MLDGVPAGALVQEAEHVDPDLVIPDPVLPHPDNREPPLTPDPRLRDRIQRPLPPAASHGPHHAYDEHILAVSGDDVEAPVAVVPVLVQDTQPGALQVLPGPQDDGGVLS